MKTKLFTLLTLLLCLCSSGVWGAVTPLSYRTIAETTLIYTSPTNLTALGFAQDGTGTQTYSSVSNRGKGLDPTDETSNNYDIGTTATMIKSSGSVKEVLMYVTNVTKVEAYVKNNSSSARKGKIVATPSSGDAINAEASTGSGSEKITLNLDASKSYTLSFISPSGDIAFYAVRITAAALSKPTITSSPVSARYAKDDTATPLTVTATTSKGTLHYQWYSNSSASTEGASAVGTDASSYTPSTSTTGTKYYYCNVSDDNGNVNSSFACVFVAEGRGAHTWNFSSIVASDFSDNTDFWAYRGTTSGIPYYTGKTALTNTDDPISIENKYTLDMCDGLLYGSGSSTYPIIAGSTDEDGSLVWYIGYGVRVNRKLAYMTYPATVDHYYRVNYGTIAGDADNSVGYTTNSTLEVIQGNLLTPISTGYTATESVVIKAKANPVKLSNNEAYSTRTILKQIKEVYPLSAEWSSTAIEFNKGTTAPTAPTFTVTADNGDPLTLGTDYSVAYSLKAGSTDGILTIDATDGITAISNSTAGEATAVATVTVLNNDYFIVTATYECTVTVTTKTTTPVITQSFNKITITCATEGSAIYYTVDGTDPTTSSSAYSAPFTIDADKTVKAFAVTDGFTDSDIASFEAEYLTIVTTQLFNFSADGWAAGSTKDGVTLGEGTSIDNNSLTIDGNSFTKRVKINNRNNANRVITFKVWAPCNIIVYDKTNSNGSLRPVGLSTGTFTSSSPTTLKGYNWAYSGGTSYGDAVYYQVTGTGPTQVNVCAADNLGIGVYGIKVVYGNENSFKTSIGATGYASLALPYAVTIPSGITAYTGTMNGSGTGITLSQINDGIIPANTGVIIQGTKNKSYTFNETTSAGTAVSNLEGTGGDTKVIVDDTDNTYYVLAANSAGNAVFAKVINTTDASTTSTYYPVIPANKAYVQVANGSGARELSFEFEDAETTGIQNVESATGNVDNYFDLLGRKVAQPTKGLYIVNGKKVIK